LVCFAIASIDPDYLRNLRQRAADGAQPGFDAADRFDQFGDMLDRGVDHSARLGDFTDGLGSGCLHRLRRVGDIVVGGDHRLGGLLQMPEPLGLGQSRCATSCTLPATSASSTPRPPILLASRSTSRSLAEGTIAAVCRFEGFAFIA